jgi:transposase
LVGQAEFILTAGGRAMVEYRDAFIGIDVAKLTNAIAIARDERNGEMRHLREVAANDGRMMLVLGDCCQV